MSKEEIVEIIKDNAEQYMLQSEVDSYIKGFLDALCKTYEITWDERYEIEETLKDD